MKKAFILILSLFFITGLFAKNAKVLYPPAGNTAPLDYDNVSSDYKTPSDFFEANYRATWNSLSEFEQYAIAFSSNLFQLNRQYHLDFTGRTTLNQSSSDPAALLKNSWGITDGESLIQMFDSLEEYGHSGAFKKLSDYLDQYPDKNPFEIAVQEKLDILDVTRLLFVKDKRKAMGSHGIEAWDEGREITILRWGVACGYITQQKAKELIEPLIARIRQNYTSWSEYIDHYITGRQFYGLYDCSQNDLMVDAIMANYKAEAYVPLDSISFTGKKADKAALKTPGREESEDFIKWQRVQKLYNDGIKKENFEELKKLEAEYSEYPTLFFWWHMQMLASYGTNEDIADYVEQNADYLAYLDQDGEVFVNSMYYYVSALNGLFKPWKTLEIISALPENLQYNIYYFYQYAYANYLMLSVCTTQEEFDAYKQRAKNAFKLLKQNNYQLNEILDNWLNNVE